MMQSTLYHSLHVAIIMDGNGRWAQQRGLPRAAGHRAGAKAVRKVVRAAPDLGVTTLTLFAFSCDNWQRPTHEVGALMNLLERYLEQELPELRERGVRLQLIGRRDRLATPLLRAIDRAEAGTADGERLTLRLAVDYSARYEIARRFETERRRERLEAARRKTSDDDHASGPDVDVLIRTSGEQRLSDFLLWESAYAELFFTSTLWPDFEARELAEIVDRFSRRDRRFGRIEEPAAKRRHEALSTWPTAVTSLSPYLSQGARAR